MGRRVVVTDPADLPADGEVLTYDAATDMWTSAASGTVAHSATTGQTADDHHAKYLDSEAIAAVEGEATLALTGVVTIGTPSISSGSGTPEGVVTAPVGSQFMRTDGGASTSLYIKESGAGNTGWVGK